MFAASAEIPHASAARILIVEDEGIIAGHIATRLEKTGYSVAGTLGSSEEALGQIPILNPDLILMDIHIKGEADGIETAIRVRERYDIPVIYLTAHTDQQTINRAKTTGAFGFLTKPIHHTSLATTIEMALHKHQAEREVRRQRAWLETVLGTMADAVVVTDCGGRIRFLNRPAESLTGWTDAEARDLDLSAVLSLAGLPADPAVPANLPAGTVAIARSGQPFPVEGEIAASMDQGRLVGRIVTFRDATSRQEEERRKRHEAKMQAVGRLAAGIAHDFNNLLFVIMGFAEELLRTGDSSRAGLSQIKKAAEAAAGITNQLLQFGRPEPPEVQDVSLNEIIAESEQIWRRLAGSRIAFDFDLDPHPAVVRADPGKIKQVMMNLVANARDAMPNGGRLIIRTGSADGFTTLTVSDTGVGMSQETVDRLFEPYFTTKSGTGTGLGLSIVHRIVSDLGGSIQVESEPGKGAAFRIRLPS
jgi:hypothetical protein